MNALITRPQLFNAYVLIEPSTWWNNKIMLKRTADFLKSSNLKGKSLYIAQANPFVADDPRGDGVDDAFSATKQLQFAEHNTGLIGNTNTMSEIITVRLLPKKKSAQPAQSAAVASSVSPMGLRLFALNFNYWSKTTKVSRILILNLLDF